jgi:hypothetical protein
MEIVLKLRSEVRLMNARHFCAKSRTFSCHSKLYLMGYITLSDMSV